MELEEKCFMAKVKVLKLEKHKLQKGLCGLRINSNKRKYFLVEKHEAEIQELKNEISEHNIRISELEQLNTLPESDQIVISTVLYKLSGVLHDRLPSKYGR